MDKQLEQQYAYLWEQLDQGWVLVKSPDLPGRYCVFNKVTSTALCIEDDEVNQAVCQRMKDAGCDVLDSIPSRIVTATPVVE